MTHQNDDAGQAEMQARADEAAEKGYIGTSVDPTPDENYTLSGVTSGAPTPETDPALAAEAAAAQKQAADEANSAAPQKAAAKKEQK